MNSNLDLEISNVLTPSVSSFDGSIRVQVHPSRRSPLRFLIGLAFAVLYWPLAAIFLTCISMISALFAGPTKRQNLGQNALGLFLGTFMDVLVCLKIICISDEELKQHAGMRGPLIIACNHPALWDALLVIRRFVRVSCIMKADLLANPLLRNGVLFAGFLPNAPNLKMIRMAGIRLRSGDRLLFFPEGTRTHLENGVLNEFRPGLALLAKQSGAPVLPVFITSNSRYLGKGWPIWRMPELPILISVKVGKIEKIQPGEGVRDFSRRMELIFRTKLH